MDDHVDWLIYREEFELALEKTRSQEKLLKRHNILGVGKNCLDFLLKVIGTIFKSFIKMLLITEIMTVHWCEHFSVSLRGHLEVD